MAELVAWLRGIDRENRGMVIDRVNREWARLAWRRHLASLPPPERGPTWLQRFWLRVRITRALEDGRPLCRLSCAERRWMQPPRSGCVVLPCRGCGRSLHVNEAHASDTRNTWFFCCSGCHPVAMQVIDEPEQDESPGEAEGRVTQAEQAALRRLVWQRQGGPERGRSRATRP